jgi:pilus assembly protein Flp/PilA
MIYVMLQLDATMRRWFGREDGQDLIEYALIVAMLALGIVSGMQRVAYGLATTFQQISTTLAQSI